MPLFNHQKIIIDEDLKKCGLFLGTGSSKTRTALELSQGQILVVCPKTQKEDQNWERENKKWDINKKLTVISKEDFRRDCLTLPRFDTVILDESHTITGVTPNVRSKNKVAIPKSSQLFDAMLEYLKRTKPERLYLCTATPARNPMSVWAAATLLGREWDFYKFRYKYYFQLPILGKQVFSAKKDEDSYESLAKLVKNLGYTGRLQDYFDVPDQVTRYIHCPLSVEQKSAILALPLEFPDPLVLIGKTHQLEQGKSKLDVIDDLVEEYPKVLIFARYTAQIETIVTHLKQKGIYTFSLTGATKDRGSLIKYAEEHERCVVVAQSQISTGYELPSFRCTIFASASYSTVDNTQAMGRTLRANALNKNLYVYLHSGKIDQAIIDCLKDHRDFSELLYAKERSLISDRV